MSYLCETFITVLNITVVFFTNICPEVEVEKRVDLGRGLQSILINSSQVKNK